MGGDAFPFQRGTDLGGDIDMLDQQVTDAVAAEADAAGIGEQGLPVAARGSRSQAFNTATVGWASKTHRSLRPFPIT
jgi:hypothetical protein